MRFPEISLGSVARIVNGGTPDTKVATYWDGGIAWLTPKDMGKSVSVRTRQTTRTISKAGLDNCSARLVPPGSVILSTRAPIGHLTINDVEMAFNQGCRGLVPSEKVDPKFLYYFLQANVRLLNELGSGTTFKELSAGALAKVQMPLPPLAEQHRIVALLDEVFEGIAASIAQAEQNLVNASDLFASALSRSFASHAKSTPLSTLTSHITDGDHMPPPKAEEGIPFITISNIDKVRRVIDFHNAFRVRPEYFNRIKQSRRPQLGDILYSVTGSFGIPILIQDAVQFCFQRHIGLIRPAPGVSARWLYYFLRSPDALAQADARASGTAQRTISLKALRNFDVPVMNSGQQDRLVDELDLLAATTDDLARIYGAKLTLLAELKHSLFAHAFSGQLTAANDNIFATPEQTANVMAFLHWHHERARRDKTYGHVKAQKGLHLLEWTAGVNLGRNPIKDAAGPNDFAHMRAAEAWAREQGFFEFVQRGAGYDFKKLTNHSKLLAAAKSALRPIEGAIERVGDLITPLDTQAAEALATVHAAWNNLLVDKREATPESIIREAREDWGPSKSKFSDSDLLAAIKLIKAKGIVPDGSAKPVRHLQPSLL